MADAKQHISAEGAPAALSSPSPELIMTHLERMMNTPEFQATAAQRELLRFVVDKTLAGHSGEIKGYTIATQVFGRSEDFDQATDPIVSIQANKLRRALDFYYLTTGLGDSVRIEIPKGTYVPVFHPRGIGLRGTLFPQKLQTEPCFAHEWPTILVQPFMNMTGDGELEYFCAGIAAEIAMEMTRYQEIRVLQAPAGNQRRATDVGARFVLDGNIKKDANGLKVGVSLVDTSTNLQIWADSHRADADPAQLIAYEEKIALTVAGKISCEDGVIAKILSPESRKIPPVELNTYQAILRFYQFNVDFSPKSFLNSYEALQEASKREPECGLVWSKLARLYAVNYSLEMFDLHTPLEKAASFARKGLIFDPANQRTRLTMAFVLLLKNELSAGLAEARHALDLNPHSLIFLDRIGYLMTLFGAWDQGPALIRKAIAENPYYNATVHHALWLDWIKQGKYDQAYRETLHFRTPALFWDPLIKAVTLGLLGKISDGRRAAENLLKCKPDFPCRGRSLIQHYIKFDDIVDRVIEGLSKVGIDIS